MAPEENWHFPRTTEQGGHIPVPYIRAYAGSYQSDDEIVAALHDLGFTSAQAGDGNQRPPAGMFRFGGEGVNLSEGEYVAAGRELRTEAGCVVLPKGAEPHISLANGPHGSSWKLAFWRLGVKAAAAGHCMAAGWTDDDPGNASTWDPSPGSE
jgi:hypothetical protein